MKHLKVVTRKAPALANTWQDILCALASVVVGLLDAKGGSLPFVTYLDQKCQPNPIHEA